MCFLQDEQLEVNNSAEVVVVAGKYWPALAHETTCMCMYCMYVDIEGYLLDEDAICNER